MQTSKAVVRFVNFSIMSPTTNLLEQRQELDMLMDVGGLALGLLVLTLGAEGLVRGSASLAVRAGLTPLIVGLTVVAFGTSTPELVVSLGASVKGQGGIAIGNVIGSNIFNIGIILGLTALICPVKVSSQVVRHDGPIMIAASLLMVGLLYRGVLSRWSGWLLLAFLAIYNAYNIRKARKETSRDAKRQFGEGIPGRSNNALLDVVMVGGGLLLLVAGSRLFLATAVDIARLLGVSEAVIGLTIIAAGTSTPELATSIVAALRRQPDIAVGNVVGSNIFNILGILGASAVVRPLAAAGITVLDLWVMAAFTVCILPLLYTELKLQRWEGGLLLAGYAAYLWVLWP
jgi:cation:H+ antiporter